MTKRNKNDYSEICPVQVVEALQAVKRGDNVTVTWCDASESADVPMDRPIHNHSVESICTAVGSFYCIQKGQNYGDLHLLILKDYLDSQRMRVQSIPLGLVKSIQIFRSESKTALITIHKRKLVLHFKDGSVKYIGGL